MKRKIYSIFLLFWSISFLSAQVVINEYSASNLHQFKDSFGKTEDWIELYNTSTSPQDISGWFLSDKEDSPTKWEIPANTMIPAKGVLVFYCSGRNGVFSNEYHTNFKLTQTKGDDGVVLANADGTILDQQALKLTLVEHSNCRKIDGGEEWVICTQPSFGTSNNGTPQIKSYTQTPSMSLAAGFYEGTQTVSIINNEPNAVIRYTTNGFNPTIESPIYTEPLTINSTTVIKATAFSNESDILPGKMAFNTYFIDESFSLAVFSVAADRVTTLADGTGRLLPIGSIEYFDKNKQRAATSFGSLNRHGQDSWVLDHRSIDWISRDEMGYSKAVAAPLFSYSERDEYQKFMFRNSGDDNYPAIDDEEHEGSTHVRDEFVQTLAQESGLKLDVRSVERVILFLNGQYWGVYGMREKVVDHDFTKTYYDQGKYDLQYLATWETTEVEYGGHQALADWIRLRDFILNNDMSLPEHYQVAEDSINMLSLIDYFIMNQGTVAADWLNYNTGWWRGRNPDGDHKKWGYILWDMDAVFDYYINYTNIPNTQADASFCDIYPISTYMDEFFSGIDSTDFEGPDFLDSIDVSNCSSVGNPYPETDTIYQLVVQADPFCCEEWDDFCQDTYNFYLNGEEGGNGNGGNGYLDLDISDCAIFQNSDFPYSPDDDKMKLVVFMNPDCCEKWGVSCENDYAIIGPERFEEEDTSGLVNIGGNIGQHEKIFLKLLEENPTFKQLFYARFADIMNTTFSCENMNTLLDRMVAVIEPEMPRQIDRWGGTLKEWRENLSRLRTFINARCAFINQEAMACHGDVEGQYSVTLMTEPAGIGEISFNTLDLTAFPWQGEYYGNMANTIQAKTLKAAENDYAFSHWESKAGNNISPSLTNRKAEIRLTTADTLVAVFKPLTTTEQNEIVINELMASNDETVADQDGEFDDWIELYNNSNQAIDLTGYFLSDNGQNLDKYDFPAGTTIAANDYLIIWADEDGQQDGLHANFKLSKSGETVFLVNPDTSIIDEVIFAAQETDIAYARVPNGTGSFEMQAATFSKNNDGNTTSNQDTELANQELHVFPNPATHQLNISLKKAKKSNMNLQLYDVYGRLVLNQEKVAITTTLDIESLANGFYLVVVNQSFRQKIVIER